MILGVSGFFAKLVKKASLSPLPRSIINIKLPILTHQVFQKKKEKEEKLWSSRTQSTNHS